MSSEAPPARSGFFSRLRDGLRKTRDSLVGKIEAVLSGTAVDETKLDELEEALLASDLGPAAARAVMESARGAFYRQRVATVEGMRALLAERIAELLVVPAAPPRLPAELLAPVKRVGILDPLREVLDVFDVNRIRLLDRLRFASDPLQALCFGADAVDIPGRIGLEDWFAHFAPPCGARTTVALPLETFSASCLSSQMSRSTRCSPPSMRLPVTTPRAVTVS